MTTATRTELIGAMEWAAQQAGIAVVSAEETRGFNDSETTSFLLALASDSTRQLRLELSSAFEFSKADLLPQMTAHLRDAALRLRNPRPNCYVTLAGLPISFKRFSLAVSPVGFRCRYVCRSWISTPGRWARAAIAGKNFCQHDAYIC